MKTKLFSLFFAIVASIGTLFAESGTCGENLTWDLTDGVLTISGTGTMNGYDYVVGIYASPWCYQRSSITSVVISDGVTSIGNYAFLGCSSLSSVDIPNSVTSIREGAFQGCSDLTVVTIGNGVTSIGDRAFYDCSSLTSVTIGNSVTSIGMGAFWGCTSLTSVNIPNSVKSIGNGAFNLCTNLTSVEIPNSVISIGDDAFFDCGSLSSINVVETNQNYSSIDGVLFNKNKTLLIQYPINKESKIYEIPSSVTSIGDGAFNYYPRIESIIIPNSVISIGERAFHYCGYFNSITNYSTTPQTIASNVFTNVDKSISLYVPEESVALYQAAEYWNEFTNIQPIPQEVKCDIRYVDKNAELVFNEQFTFHVPEAPEFDGFTFVRWEFVGGAISEGLTIQAVYQAVTPTSAPDVVINPSNPAQKLIRNGNVYILTGDKTYTITGQRVE